MTKKHKKGDGNMQEMIPRMVTIAVAAQETGMTYIFKELNLAAGKSGVEVTEIRDKETGKKYRR